MGGSRGLICGVLIFFFCFVSCGNQQSNLEEQLKAGLNTANRQDLLGRDFLIILPRIGCQGCISSVEQFMLDSVDEYSKRVGFILFDIVSIKTTLIRFGDRIIDKPNVYIDKGKILDFNGSVSLYPVIIRMKNGDVDSFEFVSPENEGAMNRLFEALTQ